MRNIFETEYLIYDLKVNIGYYLRIRLFRCPFWRNCFRNESCQGVVSSIRTQVSRCPDT